MTPQHREALEWALKKAMEEKLAKEATLFSTIDNPDLHVSAEVEYLKTFKHIEALEELLEEELAR